MFYQTKTIYNSSFKFFLFFVIINLFIVKNVFCQETFDEFDKEFEKFESQISKGNIYDPFEKFNRKIFKFNNLVDKYYIEILAKSYRKTIPKKARLSIRNFIDNLTLPVSAVNSLLQGKIDNTLSTISTFLINSTLGIGGLFDIANKKGIKYDREDFGQTLGYYGIEANAFLMLPLIGPSNVRDFGGFVINNSIDPMGLNTFNIGGDTNFIENKYRLAYTFAKIVDSREEIIDILDNIRKDSFDPYATIRSAYLQRRIAQIEN